MIDPLAAAETQMSYGFLAAALSAALCAALNRAEGDLPRRPEALRLAMADRRKLVAGALRTLGREAERIAGEMTL